MAQAKISGDYTAFRNDMAKFRTKFDKDVKQKFDSIILDSAKFYRSRYNAKMKGDGKGTLATAVVSKQSSGRWSYGTVKVSNKSVYYDKAEPHFVSLRHSPVRAWVKANWYYTKKTGWKTNMPWGMKSRIWGNANNPKGLLAVTSRELKKGISIQEETEQETRQEVERLVKIQFPKVYKSILRGIFSKKNYTIKVTV